jgi:hypothetical protein
VQQGDRRTSAEDVAAMVTGAEEPRVCSVPPSSSSAGREAIELAASAGLVLDPWEALVLERALGEREDGSWAAFEVGIVVPRQNGKGAILEARELAGLFLLGERLVIHSAHEFPTSLEAFRRLLMLVEGCPDLERRVRRVSRSHGEEGIELLGGQRIRFRTRTKGGGRGFSCDCLMLDEAMFLPEFSHGALLPTLSARPNPQVWYAASAVDQLVHEDGVVLARVRERGLSGEDPRLAYFEWSVDVESPDELDEAALRDEDVWAAANPSLGIRISVEHIESELRSMDARTFAVERLGAGDWPPTSPADGGVIDVDRWDALADPASKPLNPVCFAFDVTPTRSWASVTVAGSRPDGLVHVEVVDRRRGTAWVAARVAELVERHRPVAVVCDKAGPAASLLRALEELGVTVEAVSAKDHADACGQFYDLVEEAGLRHLGTAELTSAIKGAVGRPLGDKWAWSRRSSATDISPLVSVTLAAWGLAQAPGESVYETRGVLTV